ncbi:CAP domain-containing protein [Streptomyces atacamensis]|uniref:CAP domain-containing protein n=1 Tax=Streptomyces atacamensis TaxID=531966 RepID=UPI00399CB824
MKAKQQRGRRARRRPMVLKAAIGAAAASVAATTIVVLQPEADAIPAPSLLSAAQASTLAHRLEAKLGEEAAGSYYDPATRKLVVNVVDGGDLTAVRRAGAVAKEVDSTTEELTRAKSSLDRSTRTPGTSWAVDPRTNKVLVTVDSTVTGDEWRELREKVAKLGGKARMERVEGVFEPFVAGGDAITSGGSRCSAGFNARKGDEYFIVTAGHCTKKGAAWSSGDSSRQRVGKAVESSFPGDDYALIRYDNPEVPRPAAVNLYNGGTQEITSAGEAFVGQRVQRSGSTTGLHGGTVTGLNATVNYPQGRVHGLIRTNVCAQPGDSGGALFAGGVAIGLTSGGNGDCSSGGTTFFQPVTEVLDKFGLTVDLGSRPPADGGAGTPRPTAPEQTPAPEPTASRPAEPEPETDGAAARQVLRLVNAERTKAGCRPLTADERLARAARTYAGTMAERGVLSHVGPDGSTMASRVEAAGYSWSALAENIARGQKTPEQVMNGWMNSPGHRRNILNCAYQDIGIGVSEKAGGPWWVQNFGKRR